MKTSWKRKLSSRKFWVMIAGFVTTLLTALNVNSLTVEQVVAIIGGVGTLAVYMLAEAYVDGKSAGAVIGEAVDIADVVAEGK